MFRLRLDVGAAADAGRSSAGHPNEHSRSVDIGVPANAGHNADSSGPTADHIAASDDNTAEYAHSFASGQYGDTAASVSQPSAGECEHTAAKYTHNTSETDAAAHPRAATISTAAQHTITAAANDANRSESTAIELPIPVHSTE